MSVHAARVGVFAKASALRDQEAVGSSPATPTNVKWGCRQVSPFCVALREESNHFDLLSLGPSSEQSPLCSGFFCRFQQKRNHPPAPLPAHLRCPKPAGAVITATGLIRNNKFRKKKRGKRETRFADLW